jgi:hypothetical protein
MNSKIPVGLSHQAAKEKILAKLKRAGRRGAPRGGLGFTAKTPYSTIEALERALAELEQEGSITQIFTRPIPRFFVSKEAPQLERVAEKIATRAALKSGRLLSLADLEKALVAVEKPLAEKAAALLVGRATLARLRYQARDLYTDAAPLREMLSIASETATPPAAPNPIPLVPKKKRRDTGSTAPSEPAKMNRKAPPTTGLDLFGLFETEKPSEVPERQELPRPRLQVLEPDSDAAAVAEAYRQLVHKTGFPDVEIAELANTGAFPLEAFKEFLHAENAVGRAIFSLGDWSLASESTRAGAVVVGDQPHLLVRFPAP